jgi:thiol-disulfide isomerase/thioredoxin
MDLNQRFSLLLMFVLGATVGVVVESHVLRPLSGETVQSNNTRMSTSEVVAFKPSTNVPEERTRQPGSEDQIHVAGTAKLVVDEPLYDFGNIERGNLVKHAFVLRNEGDAPLNISGVKPACGCTVARLTSEVIKPGDEARLDVSLNLKLQEGPQNRSILIQSNDPLQPNLTLSLMGTATSRVVCNPKRVDFDHISDTTERVSKVVEVQAVDGLSIDVSDTRTSGEQVSAEVETVEAGKHYRVTISFDPEDVAGRFKGWVHLQTSDTGEYRVIGIPVAAQTGNGTVGLNAADPYARLVGEPLEISGPTLGGGQTDVARMREHPTVVVFWASWCGYCKREIPQLVALHDQYSSQGLRIIGVNVDQDPEKALEACTEFGIPWQNIHFPSNGSKSFVNPLSARYGIGGIPTVILLDREGKVLTSARGDALRQRVEKLLRDSNLGAAAT